MSSTEGADGFDYAQAGANLLGGYLSAKSAKRAAAAEKKRALEDRAFLKEEAINASADIRKGARPLLQQANRLEIQSGYRNAALEQGLTAGLRNQAAGVAAQAQAQGLDTTNRQAVTAQLLQGQGLLATENLRLQRFTELSNLSANLRGQGAQIMGSAAETRLAGMQAVTAIQVKEDPTNAWGAALTAFGSS